MTSFFPCRGFGTPPAPRFSSDFAPSTTARPDLLNKKLGTTLGKKFGCDFVSCNNNRWRKKKRDPRISVVVKLVYLCCTRGSSSLAFVAKFISTARIPHDLNVKIASASSLMVHIKKMTSLLRLCYRLYSNGVASSGLGTTRRSARVCEHHRDSTTAHIFGAALQCLSWHSVSHRRLSLSYIRHIHCQLKARKIHIEV